MLTSPQPKATYWTKQGRRSGGRPCKCPRGPNSLFGDLTNSHSSRFVAQTRPQVALAQSFQVRTNRWRSRNERGQNTEARSEKANRQFTDAHDVEKRDSPRTDDSTDDTPSMSHVAATDDDDRDPNVVWWDGENDPDHPFNWSSWKTFSNIALISALTFVSPLASCETILRLLQPWNMLTRWQPYLLLVSLSS